MAQERIDKLFALEGPIKVAQTDSQGNDTPTADAREAFNQLLFTLQERSAAAARTDKETNGHATGPMPVD